MRVPFYGWRRPPLPPHHFLEGAVLPPISDHVLCVGFAPYPVDMGTHPPLFLHSDGHQSQLWQSLWKPSGKRRLLSIEFAKPGLSLMRVCLRTELTQRQNKRLGILVSSAEP